MGGGLLDVRSALNSDRVLHCSKISSCANMRHRGRKPNKKSRPRAALNLIALPADHAAINAGFDLQR
jgi:hypothetical protein